ncbi:hypothetical protein PC119_g18253 [Phytophthora cactorum]|nr:hypothetical protein PC119_g18253 [Phytophthora cactorum]
MNFCTTRPPNSDNLRDDVIGNVNQRRSAVHAASSHQSAEEKKSRKRKRESVVDISSF